MSALPRERVAGPIFRLKPLVLAVAAALSPWSEALALPTGEQVVAGQVGVSRPTSQSMLMQQGSSKAIVNWQGFSIGGNESVSIQQPAASSVILNRVVGNNASEIYGRLNANGQVFLVNPSGVLFGRTAMVDVGALVASTLSIGNEDFLAGRYRFTGNGKPGMVENQGALAARDGGFIALLGGQVSNSGTISARLGTAGLAAGNKITLDFAGDGLVRITVDEAALAAEVRNSGAVIADGGQAILSARSAEALTQAVVNQTGIVRARTLTERQGKIVLDGGSTGQTLASGTLDASGPGSGQKGGEIQVLGHHVGITGTALLDASGDSGGGSVLVGGDYQGKNAAIRNASATWFGPDATIRADALTQGDGGKVIVWGEEATRAYGTISAKGGPSGGDGGLIETSGKYLETAGIRVNASAPRGAAGEWLLDPINITIVDGAEGDSSNVSPSPNFTSNASPAVVTNGDIAAALNAGTGTDVSITTTNPEDSQQLGDISIAPGVVINRGEGTEARLLSLNAIGSIRMGSSSSIVSTSGPLNVDFNSYRLGGTVTPAISGGAILMDPGSSIYTNGGSVRFYGASNADTGRARGVSVTVSPGQTIAMIPTGIALNGASINTCVGGSTGACTGGSGGIILRGVGVPSTNSLAAVALISGGTGVSIVNSALRTSSGEIFIDGLGGTGGLGTSVTGSLSGGSSCASVVCTDSGRIRILGSGGNLASGQIPAGQVVAHGVVLSTPLRTQSGDVEISGTGGNWSAVTAEVGPVHGVVLTPDIASGSSNRISITGVGGNDGSSDGVPINAYGVTAAAGNIRSPAGRVIVDGGTFGTELAAGIDVSNTGGTGGDIRVVGGRVGLIDAAMLDARGSSGGGQILVGGGLHGSDTAVPNANATFVDSDVTLDASTTASGNGGTVVVWSNAATRAYGTLRANGSPNGGNGGTIETSGAFLDVNGIRVSASAPQGTAGQWLIDPIDVTISHGTSTAVSGPPDFTATAAGANVQDTDIQNALNSGTSVTVSTGASTGGQGNITVRGVTDDNGEPTTPTVIEKTVPTGGAVTLSLNAHNNIWIREGVRIASSSGRLNLDLNSNSANTGVGQILVGNPFIPTTVEIRTNGGNVRMFGGGDPVNGRARGQDFLVAVPADQGTPNAVQLIAVTIDTTPLGGGPGGNVVVRGQAGFNGPTAGIGVGAAFDTVINTGSGNITLDGIAGPGMSNITGDGAGVVLDRARLSTDSGTITITGRGSTPGSLPEPGGDGVRFVPFAPGTLSSVTTSSGAIVINGTGGAGGSSQSTDAAGGAGGNGFSVSDWSMQTGSGNITITGTGGAGGAGFNNSDGDGTSGGAGGVGVLLGTAPGPVIQTSSGAIQIASFGGNGGAGGSGIDSGDGGAGGVGFNGGGATILTGSALAQIGGSGGNGGTGGNCSGTPTFFCGSGGSGGAGVLLNGLTQAAGGSVQVRGLGGSGAKGGDGSTGSLGGFSGSGGNGISTSGTASIVGTSGSITLNGAAGQGGSISLTGGVPSTGPLYVTFSGIGVSLFGNVTGNPTIGTTSGDIFITGLSTSADRGAIGVSLSGITIETTGGGSIDIRGRGDGPNLSTGVDIFTTTTIRTQGTPGTIVISGESTSADFGVAFGEEGGTNLIGGPTTSGNIVVRAANAGGGDSIDLIGNTTIRTRGVINLRPGGVSSSGSLSPVDGATIEIGVAPIPPAPAAVFVLSPGELDSLADGAAAIVIGGSTHTGLIRLLTPYPFKDNVTLQNAGAGSQGIALEAALSSLGNLITLSSGGPVTQQVPIAPITANSLLLQGTGTSSNFALTNTANSVAQFAAASPLGGQVRFENTGVLTIGPLAGTGFDSASNTPTTISAPNTVSFGDLFIRTTGNLSLGDAGVAHNVSTLASDIDLVTGGIFNNVGGGVLLPGGGGSWRVWASTWEGENRGGLVPTSPFPNFYGCTYPGTCLSGITIPTTGNRFIYQERPTLTLVADGKSRLVGQLNPPFTSTVSGLVNGDTQADAVVANLSSPATQTSPASTYPINVTGASSPVGYIVSTVDGRLNVLDASVPRLNELTDSPRLVATEESLLYARNLGTPFMCTPSGPLAVPASVEEGSDNLAREWSRVRVRPNLTNCMGLGQRGGCDDF